MSIEKITQGSKMIKFSHLKLALFEKTALAVSLMAKNQLGAKEEPIGDDLFMSQDEQPFFEDILHEIFLSIQDSFSRLSNDIENAFGIENEILSIIVLDREAYSPNNLKLIDRMIEKTLVDGCVYRWFALKNYDSLANKSLANFTNSTQSLGRQLFFLKKSKTGQLSLGNG